MVHENVQVSELKFAVAYKNQLKAYKEWIEETSLFTMPLNKILEYQRIYPQIPEEEDEDDINLLKKS